MVGFFPYKGLTHSHIQWVKKKSTFGGEIMIHRAVIICGFIFKVMVNISWDVPYFHSTVPTNF